MPNILLVNNDGSGFANHVDVPEGTTALSLFSDRMPDRDPGEFLIKVNREQVEAGYTLQDGDKVTMTPVNIEGA